MASVLAEPDVSVEDLLRLPKEVQANLVAVLEQLHRTKYTGPVTFHYHLGEPKTIQLLPPQIRLSADS